MGRETVTAADKERELRGAEQNKPNTLLLQLIILFRFSGRTADQVTTKCIKVLTLGPMSTSSPSFQQLHACGTRSTFISDPLSFTSVL